MRQFEALRRGVFPQGHDLRPQLRRLALGRTDFVINTVINLQALVKEKPNVFALGQAVTGPSYPAWAVKKGNADLLAAMNDFLAKQKASGSFYDLQKKWFGVAMDAPTTMPAPNY